MTKKQSAANQLRSIRAIKDRIERLEMGWSDDDGYMTSKAQEFFTAAEEYESELIDVLEGEQ